jgi:hypothetical protein
MPFDGTDLGFFENHPLTKLGAVERLLATKQLWCKHQLRDRDGRYCLVGAMEAVKARQVLEPIILRAAREVGGKHYWRIEFFNDDPRTSHADILRVLSLARENIIANIIQRRSRRQRLAQAVRALCSGSAGEAYAALRFGAIRTPRPSPKAPAVTLPTATPAVPLDSANNLKLEDPLTSLADLGASCSESLIEARQGRRRQHEFPISAGDLARRRE